jgi:ferredoxin--NADP+ reductase
VASVTSGTETDVTYKRKVPVELEKGPMPINTFGPKAPFIGKVKSVERIVGPKATGETCHIIIETNGGIPFWEGQSYGVVPPVSIGGPISEHWWKA